MDHGWRGVVLTCFCLFFCLLACLVCCLNCWFTGFLIVGNEEMGLVESKGNGWKGVSEG